MSELTKRSRASNFSSFEVSKLIKLVNQYRHIIQCKNIDKSTWNQKEEAWEQLAVSYNASVTSDRFRTSQQLRAKYENIKKEMMKKLRSQRRATAGAPNETTSEESEAVSIDPLDIDSLNDLGSSNTTLELDSEGKPEAPDHILGCVTDMMGLRRAVVLSPQEWGEHYAPELRQPTPIAPTHSDVDETPDRKTTFSRAPPDEDESRAASPLVDESQRDLTDLKRHYLHTEEKRRAEKHKLEMEVLRLEVEIKKARLRNILNFQM